MFADASAIGNGRQINMQVMFPILTHDQRAVSEIRAR